MTWRAHLTKCSKIYFGFLSSAFFTALAIVVVATFALGFYISQFLN
jgi:hypothetical protein